MTPKTGISRAVSDIASNRCTVTKGTASFRVGSRAADTGRLWSSAAIRWRSRKNQISFSVAVRCATCDMLVAGSSASSRTESRTVQSTSCESYLVFVSKNVDPLIYRKRQFPIIEPRCKAHFGLTHSKNSAKLVRHVQASHRHRYHRPASTYISISSPRLSIGLPTS